MDSTNLAIYNRFTSLVLRRLGINGTPYEIQQIGLACQSIIKDNPIIINEKGEIYEETILAGVIKARNLIRNPNQQL